MSSPMDARVAVVLKGWPRLSETFIAQEIAGLEARGVVLEIWSLRRPTDKHRHPVHDRVQGRVVYLPEYLKERPGRRPARNPGGRSAPRLRRLADGAPPAGLCHGTRALSGRPAARSFGQPP